MATKIVFNKKALSNLEPPPIGRTYIYDKSTPSLTVCVTSSGTRTFYLYRRIRGKPVRTKIGRFPQVSVEQARKIAAKMNGGIADGKVPHASRQSMKLSALFDLYLEKHAKPRKRTWAEDKRQFDKLLKSWHTMRTGNITRADVNELHAKVGREHGPYAANRLLALLKTIFNYGIRNELIESNPCLTVETFPESKRERFLSKTEVKRFFESLANEPDLLFRDFFLTLLLSGARRANVQAMRWQDVHLDRALWVIPGESHKNGLPVAVVLVPQLVTLLETRRDEGNGSDWVFPSVRGKHGHITEPRMAWGRICERAKLENLRVHDLRHTLASWQAMGGSSLHMIGQSLGHRDAQTTARYAHLVTEDTRESVTSATTAMVSAGGASWKKLQPKKTKARKRVKR